MKPPLNPLRHTTALQLIHFGAILIVFYSFDKYAVSHDEL